MDRQELERLTVPQLREMAAQYEDITSASGMKKEELQAALAEKLGIDLQDHVATGIGRHDLKAHIREAKKARDAALQAGDRETYLKARRRLKHYRRRLRRVIGVSLRQQTSKPKTGADAES